MKNVIDLLEQYYQSFINQQEDWPFFLGIYDYVQFIIENPKTDKIASSIVKERIKQEKSLKKCEEKVIPEIHEAKRKLVKKIKVKKINYKELNNLIDEYEKYEKGRIVASSNPMPINIAYCLEDIINSLYRNGYYDIIKDVVILHHRNPKIIEKYNYSKTLDTFRDKQKEFNKEKETAIWGAWNDLLLAYKAIDKSSQEELKKIIKEEKSFLKAMDWKALLWEMGKIREKYKRPNISYNVHHKEFSPIHFIRTNYISFASRFHNYLIKKLTTETKSERQKEDKTSFNHNNGILNFRNKKIQISKSKNTNTYFLIKTLFKNKTKNWNYDEIYEEMFGEEYDKSKWRKIYNAAYDINEKIAKKTTINDFLQITKVIIRIKNKYL